MTEQERRQRIEAIERRLANLRFDLQGCVGFGPETRAVRMRISNVMAQLAEERRRLLEGTEASA